MWQVEDILGQLKEHPDILPVVSLPPSGSARPGGADSLSPNRSNETGGSTDEPVKSPPDAAGSPISAAAAAVAAHLHSRSASLDGGDVCPAPSDSAGALAATQNANPIHLAPLSISNISNSNNPVVAVTVDGATPPVVAIPAPQFPTTAASQPPPAGSLAEPAVEPAEPPKVFLIVL